MNSLSKTNRTGSNISSVIMVLAAAALWGIIGVFSRQLSAAGLNAVQITFLRCFFATVFLLIWLLLRNRSAFRIRLRSLPLFLGTGLCSIVFFNICYFLTLSATTVSVASILLYTAPFFVILLSAVFFHERITIQKLIALLLAFIGCCFITGIIGSSVSLTGTVILTGIGSGLGYGLYSIFAKPALKEYSSDTVTFYTFLVASIGIFPFSQPGEMLDCFSKVPISIVWALLLALISTLLPFLLYTKGLERLEAGKASVMAFFEPLTATLTGILIFHEKLTLWHVIGILLIFTGVVLLNIRRTTPGKHSIL